MRIESWALKIDSFAGFDFAPGKWSAKLEKYIRNIIQKYEKIKWKTICCFDLLLLLLPLEPEVRQAEQQWMPQDLRGCSQRQHDKPEQDNSQIVREREGRCVLSLSCHCYDCCNTLCEQITMSDYFVINKYKSVQYTHTHVHTHTVVERLTHIHTPQPAANGAYTRFYYLFYVLWHCTQNVY